MYGNPWTFDWHGVSLWWVKDQGPRKRYLGWESVRSDYELPLLHHCHHHYLLKGVHRKEDWAKVSPKSRDSKITAQWLIQCTCGINGMIHLIFSFPSFSRQDGAREFPRQKFEAGCLLGPLALFPSFFPPLFFGCFSWTFLNVILKRSVIKRRDDPREWG